MKRTHIYKAALGLLLLPLLSSCDNVDPADRLIPIEKAEASKSVLVLEFTGQMCVNCPTGASTVHSLMEAYPGKVISVNLHPKNTIFTNVPAAVNLGLTSEIATEYYQEFRPNAFPAAMVDFAAPNEKIATWTGLVMTALEESTPVEIELASSYDEASRSLTVDYTASFADPYADSCSVLILLTENGIVGFQTGAANPAAYTHNHVARASMTGKWGESLGSGFRAGDKVSGSASLVLDPAWNPGNMEVVGAVLAPSHSVLNCAQIPLMK